MTNYEPSKNYSWKPEDTFILTGQDFGLILNTFRAVLSKPEAQLILASQQAANILEGVLAKAVEDGVAIETVQTTEE